MLRIEIEEDRSVAQLFQPDLHLTGNPIILAAMAEKDAAHRASQKQLKTKGQKHKEHGVRAQCPDFTRHQLGFRQTLHTLSLLLRVIAQVQLT